MPRISVIVVSYNVRAFLASALRTAEAALSSIDSEIIVVDNASTDGSVDMLHRQFPGIRVIISPENLGFAGANNLAIESADGDYIALVNPDTIIHKDAFHVCMNYLDSHSDTGMVGCKILNGDGTLQLACRRSFPTPWIALTKVLGLSALFPHSRRFGRYNLTYLDENKIEDVEAISGSFMFIRKKVLEQTGGLDDQFFMYGEDLDLCYRIHQAGWKITYLPQARIIHYKGQSAMQAGFKSLINFYEAMRLFVKKHFTRGWLWLPRWLIIAGIGLRGSLSFIMRLIKPWFGPIIDGIALQLALLSALILRFGHIENYSAYTPVNVLYTAVWLMACFLARRYRDPSEAFQRLTAGIAIGLIINTSLTFFLPQWAFSRQVLATMGVLGWFIMNGINYFIRKIKFFSGSSTGNKASSLFVGTDNSQVKLAQSWHQLSDKPYRDVGFIYKDDIPVNIPAHKVLGSFDDVPGLLPLHRIDQIVFPFETGLEHAILCAYKWRKIRTIKLKITCPEDALSIQRDTYDVYRNIPLAQFNLKIDEPYFRLFKRFIDISLGIILLLPFTYLKFCKIRGRSFSPFVESWVECWFDVVKGVKSWVGAPDAGDGFDRQVVAAYKRGWITPLYGIKNIGESNAQRAVFAYYLSQYKPWIDLKLIGKAWKQGRLE
ncbi:glycosyltransferase [bacterium]|nr:glycosyltransferase [bacterium]